MFRKCLIILMLSLVTVSAFAKNESHSKKIILQFNTMFGVDAPFLSSNPTATNDPLLRGVLGDYQPWAIKHANGKLFSDGTLIINIKGLTFIDPSTNLPTNDETHFRALVSCQLTADIPDPNNPNVILTPATFSNVITDPPTPVETPIDKGNANIKAKVALPTPCVAPVVMILNGDHSEGDVWFAITGN